MQEDFVNTNNRYMIDQKSDPAISNQGMQLTTYLASQYSFSNQTVFGDLLI